MTPVVGEILGWEFLLVIAIVILLFGSTLWVPNTRPVR
jgi:hypothetical protein